MSFRNIAVVAMVALSASVAGAQNPNHENNIDLQNGSDLLYVFSDPSVGSPQGTAPNLNGDFYWKVFPKEVMNIGSAAQSTPPNPAHNPGTMEVSGQDFEIYDTDWTTPAIFYDQILTTGSPNTGVGSVGNIVPNFAAPGAVLIFLNGAGGTGNSGLPPPAVPCPPGGGVAGYAIDIQFGTGTGDGIIVPADGQTDLVLVSFCPAGMQTTTGGQCGAGDYTFENAQSTNQGGGYPEQQADWLANGRSAYSGYQLGNPVTGRVADPRTETPHQSLQFFEPTIVGRIDVGNGSPLNPEIGTAALHASTSNGSVQYGYRVFAREGVGDFAVVALGSFVPSSNPLAPPGLAPILGFPLMLDPQDPLFNLSLYLPGFQGTVALVNNGGGNFDDGVFDTSLVPIPVFIQPLQIVAQAAVINSVTGNVSLTNTFVTWFGP